MTKNRLTILLGILILLFFIYQYNKSKIVYKELLIKGDKAIAKIHPMGSNLIFDYTVNGRIFTHKVSKPFDGLQEGEYYEVIYKRSNPDESEILFSNPIIMNIKEYDSTNTISIRDISLNPAVVFTYQINGQEFERYQIPMDKQAINEAKSYLVRYLIKNPKVAYIIFDQKPRTGASL
ncbi:MAG: hypothetical protein V4714_16980 [Bacteroidota bacterium]